MFGQNKLLFIMLSLALALTGCSAQQAPSSQLGPTAIPSLPAVGSPPPAPATLAAPTQVLASPPADPMIDLRLSMVEDTIAAREVTNPDVLKAMRLVPRHEFVPAQYQPQAYEDHPLPIGYGQTISQPFIVAWMTELIEPKAGEKVLEIGTGSGYQAAVLAQLGYLEVYSIEIVPELAEIARGQLEGLGYTNVHLVQGDGYYGWPEKIEFDAILVTAAPDHVPALLVAQLADGGRMVIPIGPTGGFQTLWKFVKGQGELKAYNLGAVSFVPLTGPGVEAAPTEPSP